MSLTFSTFDTHWIPDEHIATYQLRLNKSHIYTSSTIELLDTVVKEAEEITASATQKLLDTIQ